MNEEEKQAIEYLERHILPYCREGKIKFMLNDIILNLIKKQQKEIEKLKSKKYILNAETNEIKEIPISDDYISKDKIKEKIKEIETMPMLDFAEKEKFDFKYSLDGLYCMQKGVVFILKELLGE